MGLSLRSLLRGLGRPTLSIGFTEHITHVSHFEQAVQDRVDLDAGGVCLSCGLHEQKQRADVCGGDIGHFQLAQGRIYPMVEIALISAPAVFAHGHGLGGHKDFFAVLP